MGSLDEITLSDLVIEEETGKRRESADERRGAVRCKFNT